jgi:hypothetical protein
MQPEPANSSTAAAAKATKGTEVNDGAPWTDGSPQGIKDFTFRHLFNKV